MRVRLQNTLVFITAIAVAASVHGYETDPYTNRFALTGSWSGPIGPGILEENWVKPVDGSIASLVRMTGEGKTSMVELIIIEEEDNTLVLRIKQWDPGFSPRTPNPQKMILTDLSDNRVSFTAAEDGGGLNSLTYSRSTDDTFTITVENSEGAKFDISLSPMK